MNSSEQTSRLEALAVLRLMAQDRQKEASMMLADSEDPVGLARAACGLAVAAFYALGPERANRMVERFTSAALAEG